MAIELTDDGTLDTVLRCSHCGEEFRFNYDAGTDNTEEGEGAYDAFVDWCIESTEDDHECDQEALGPQDEDITTEDHHHFYYLGRCIVTVDEDVEWEPYVGAWCKQHGYFPNVWSISDHGNACLISVSDDGRYLGGAAD